MIRRDTDYAIRALVHLATREKDVVPVGEVAAAEDVPVEFLRKLLQRCARAGLVKPHRGPRGGFSLAKPPREITVLEVVEALQGPVAVNRCLLGKDACPRSPTCPLRRRWLEIGREVADFMREVTLEDLAAELIGLRRERRAAKNGKEPAVHTSPDRTGRNSKKGET